MILTYIMAAIALVGSIFNARRLRVGFAIWIVTNVFWIVWNAFIGEYAQVALYVANLIISTYGFIRWRKPYKNLDKFYINTSKDLISWVYYNPDSDSGGQYVTNKFDCDLILKAEQNTQSSEAFFDYIGTECRQYLSDKGSKYYESMDRKHRCKKASLLGTNENTVQKLINYAKKKQKEVYI